LSKFNIDSKFGKQALETVMKSIVMQDAPLVTPPTELGPFFEAVRKGLMGVGLVNIEDSKLPTLDKDFNVINKFLNRILGLEVVLQNALFKYFGDTLDAHIKQAKRSGRFDSGIMDLTSDQRKVDLVERQKYYIKHSTGMARIELHNVAVDRGMSWEEAHNLWSQCTTPEEGFYTTQGEHMTRKGIMLAVADTSTRSFSKHIFRIYKPNTGLQSKTETVSSLKDKARKLDMEKAKELWTELHTDAETKCAHVLWYGSCRRANSRVPCDIGTRRRTYHVLCGSVLTVWALVERAAPHVARLQIMRFKYKDGLRVIGTQIPPNSVEPLAALLAQNQ
jgi:hypothetical protein